MTLGVFIGGQVLASVSLGFGSVFKTARQEKDDHRRTCAFNAFHFNDVCFPFFAPAS